MEFQLSGGLTFGVGKKVKDVKEQRPIAEELDELVDSYAEEYEMNDDEKTVITHLVADVLDTVDQRTNTNFCKDWGDYLERKY